MAPTGAPEICQTSVLLTGTTLQLDDRRILLNRSGNIAEASLALNHVFEDAQKAADQYVSEIRRIKEDTEKQAKDILQKARKKAGQDE